MPAAIRARRPLRLLTLGHSYALAANRVLPDALAREGGERWAVTIAAPERVATDRGVRPLQEAGPGGVRLVSLPVAAPRRPHWMAYGRSLRALLREEWDVVHCWQEPFVWSAGQVARWCPPGARLVYATFQNLPKRYPPPFSWIERRALGRADGWIAFGHTVAEALRGRAGYRERPCRVIPPALDLARFSADPEARARAREALGWAADARPVVGYVGRLVPEKGIATLLRALDGVPGCRVVVVGDGPLHPEVARWVERRGDAARLVTGADHDRVPSLMAALDVLCLPSVDTPRWREQFGRVLAEGMAAGLLVIGSDAGEIPHVIGDAGLVVPPGDAPALRAAIGRAVVDADLRSGLAARGRARAAREFSAAVVARRHLDFFEALVGGGTC